MLDNGFAMAGEINGDYVELHVVGHAIGPDVGVGGPAEVLELAGIKRLEGVEATLTACLDLHKHYPVAMHGYDVEFVESDFYVAIHYRIALGYQIIGGKLFAILADVVVLGQWIRDYRSVQK